MTLQGQVVYIRPFFSFSGHFSCSVINWKLFYDPKHISSVQWNPLLAQEQTLMLLGIIHQEKTLGEMQDFYVDQRVSIFHHAASLCVFLKCCLMLRLRFALKVAGIPRLDLCFINTRWPSAGGGFVCRGDVQTVCVWKRDGSLSEDKTTVIEYKPLRTTSQARHYILKSALFSITNAFKLSIHFCLKIAW